jgi:hypothetical protein
MSAIAEWLVLRASAAAELDVVGKVKGATVIIGERDVALDEVRSSPTVLVTSGITVTFLVVQSGLSTRVRPGISRAAVPPRMPRRSPSSSSAVASSCRRPPIEIASCGYG